MVVTNDRTYQGWEESWWARHCGCKRYSPKEIEDIIENGSLLQKISLSVYFYNTNGYYRQIITHYATLLKYAGILIPNPVQGRNLSKTRQQKRYESAIDFVDSLCIEDFSTKCAFKALIYGCYYGIILQADKDNFAVLELPSSYCRTRFRDLKGRDIIEFDLNYFRTLKEKDRRVTLDSYPKLISKAYKDWENGKIERWLKIPGDSGVCFPFFDGTPFFLNVIPYIIRYDEGLDIERERDLDETRKIVVQHMPHLSDGRLVFEPVEAEEMHVGAVGMLKGNRNISVLTTYADVDAIVSKTSSDNSNTTVENLLKNIYSAAGVSSQIFASTGSSTLENSIKNDISLMMFFANKIAAFITNIVNLNCADKSLRFEYKFLPVSLHNEDKYVETAFKLASSGFSFIVPAAAMGISQKELINLKDLENNILKLGEKLIPLASSYTQSGSGEVGAPKKDDSEKAEKTIANETSLDNQTE